MCRERRGDNKATEKVPQTHRKGRGEDGTTEPVVRTLQETIAPQAQCCRSEVSHAVQLKNRHSGLGPCCQQCVC